MLKKLFILFKIARKLALSDALKVVSKFHKPPLIIKILVSIFSISFSKNNYESNKLTDEEKLCTSLPGISEHDGVGSASVRCLVGEPCYESSTY